MQYGKSVRYCGHALSFDDVFIDGDLATHTFVAYYISMMRCPKARRHRPPAPRRTR